MGVNRLPKTVTRHRRGCDLNPGPSAPESSTLTTRLPIQPGSGYCFVMNLIVVQGFFFLGGEGQYAVMQIACHRFGCALKEEEEELI